MPTGVSLICRHGLNHKHITGNQYESGNWVVSDQVADELVRIRGLITLHEHQNEKAWHGGRVLGWRASETDGKKIFLYEVTPEFRDFVCRTNWGMEKAYHEEFGHMAMPK